ncbi:MAG: pirin-like C-terminal cupin domain-containing protein, partial [Nevskiales bacterium]
VVSGELAARSTRLEEHCMAVFDATAGVEITASVASRIAIIGGEAMGSRFIDWNFVSSRKERIAQAREDWKGGRFPKVPGDDEEFIPLPE